MLNHTSIVDIRSKGAEHNFFGEKPGPPAGHTRNTKLGTEIPDFAGLTFFSERDVNFFLFSFFMR